MVLEGALPGVDDGDGEAAVGLPEEEQHHEVVREMRIAGCGPAAGEEKQLARLACRRQRLLQLQRDA
eukprot:3043590-Prymnesium_polylepis.1